MKKFTKSLAILLSLIMCFGILPLASFAANLAEPTNLRWDNMTAKWDAVSGATDYKVDVYSLSYQGYKDYVIELAETTATQYNCSQAIIGDDDGIYYFKIYARNSSGGSSSTCKNPIVVVDGKIIPDTTIYNLDWDGQTLKWDAVAGINGYHIEFYNGITLVNKTDVTVNQINCSNLMNNFGIGSYTAKVFVIAGDGYGEPTTSPSYFYINGIPNVRWDGQVAKWSAVSGATEYRVNVYKDGSIPAPSIIVTETQVDCQQLMNNLGNGNYSFTVEAKVNGTYGFLTSSVIYKYTEGEDIGYYLRWEGQIAKWNAVPGATEYRVNVYKDGSIPAPSIIVTETQVDCQQLMNNLGNGNYSFSVEPKVNGSYGSAMISPIYQYTDGEDIGYYLRWEGQIAKWNAVPGATEYRVNVYKDGSIPAPSIIVTETQVDCQQLMNNLGNGNYSFSVEPKVNGSYGSAMISPIYQYTDGEDIGYYLRWEGQIAKWNAVPGATEYRVNVYKDGSIPAPNIIVTETQVDCQQLMNNLGNGNYSFSVEPKINGSYGSAMISPIYQYTDGEDIGYYLRWEGQIAKWNAVPGATEYRLNVYKDGSIKVPNKIVTETQVDCQQLMNNSGYGTYFFTVEAKVNGSYGSAMISSIYQHTGGVTPSTEISQINLNVAVPKAGDAPAAPTTTSTDYGVLSYIWNLKDGENYINMKSGDKFEAGKTYELLVFVKISLGSEKTFTNSATCLLNGTDVGTNFGYDPDRKSVSSMWEFTVTAPQTKTLTSIFVSKGPSKKTYIAGENFSTANTVVKAYYSDGTSKTILSYDIIDGTNLTAGQTSVTISYTEGGVTKTTTVAITVNAPTKTLSSISVTTQPTKKTYTAGENFNKSGMVVKANYSDSTSATITSYTITNGNNLTAGQTSVTISYTEGGVTKTASVAITVTGNISDPTPTIAIKNNPGTKTINYGEGVKFTAITTNLPAGAQIKWYVNGVEKGTGTTFTFSDAKADATITAKVVDNNGNVIKDASDGEISASEKITVKAGFFQKLISFFKNLFKANRIIEQGFESDK